MRAPGFLLVALLALAGSTRTWAEDPAPEAPEARKPVDVRQALRRGVDYLVAAQRKDGSWGSPASNLHDIYAPAPGSQRSFQVGSAGLATRALVESGDTRPEVQRTIDRARDFLLRKVAVRRIRTDTLYNTWALGYGLEALAVLIPREQDAQKKAELLAAAQLCVKMLIRFEFVEGGWGYYNFSEKTARPGPGSTSFTTATNLVALMLAKAQGVRVPARLIQRCINVIRRCERPDNSYYYGPDYIFYSVLPVNKVKGSLARTPACLVGLADAGSTVPVEKLVKGLDDLERHGHFLRIARKYTRPHESWYQNSGYFCLYGYYYAAMCLRYVPKAVAQRHAGHIARHVAGMQERDGSVWDYQLFNYHKAYGTGYAVSALKWCLDQQSRAD